MNNSKNNNDWKDKFQGLLNSCQSEIKRTTKIGMKMLHASQSNVQLHEKYEELGQLVLKAHEEGILELKDAEALKIIEDIKHLESELHQFEKDVKDIKED